jgi:hypothetical protein
MKKLVQFGSVLALALVVGAAAQPAMSACAGLRTITGGYVYSPGWCDGGYPCGGGTSLSDGFQASFWHVGNGNPTIGLGSDSGGLAPTNILVPTPDYPALIGSVWSGGAVDGCIDAPQPGGPAARCMAILATDVDSLGAPVFALMTAAANSLGNYPFGDGPFTMAPLPKLLITNSVRAGGGTSVAIEANLDPDGLAAGLYLSTVGECTGVTAGGAGSLIGSYQLRYQTLARGGETPSDFDPDQWTPCGGPVPLGQPGICDIPTPGDVDVFVSYTMNFDSGFETGHVGDESSRVQGGPNIADPDPKLRIRRSNKEDVRSR